MTQNFDVIVVGGGHAGIEAVLAASRLNCRAALFTMTLDTIGLMPCNPSIGGPAKGQIVGEIDALGGEMGFAADKTHIQMKILNRSRGPAVQCLRSQNDKHDYNAHMKNRIMTDPNITVVQHMVGGLIIEDDVVKGVVTTSGERYPSKTVVITAGTFLKSKMYTGLDATIGGRIGEASSDDLSDSLRSLFRIGRLKTGTPPRLHKDSIDYSKMTLQPGDNECLRFSFRTPYTDHYKHQIACHLTHTNPDTHTVILNGLDRSPLYTGIIDGVGPRYCPSIEDKVVRFRDKDSHQIFIEPEGRNTVEVYPQGLNTSLPNDVQEGLLRSMVGLENVEILKFGYAVEYDFFFPDQLFPTLETRPLKNLYFAGQINGTSGYEEAAGQGVIAGANAGLRAKNKPPFILTREDSFIGTMIDDLISKNIFEPYRMMTSRSEYRLLLRQDNAPFRLGEKAYEAGLISLHDMTTIRHQKEAISSLRERLEKARTSDHLMSMFHVKQKIPVLWLLKRNNFTIDLLIEEGLLKEEEREAMNRLLVEERYSGYVDKQQMEINKIKALEHRKIPASLDWDRVSGLKKESREKFKQYKPSTIYEAKKIAGINPADIMVMIMYLERTSLK